MALLPWLERWPQQCPRNVWTFQLLTILLPHFWGHRSHSCPSHSGWSCSGAKFKGEEEGAHTQPSGWWSELGWVQQHHEGGRMGSQSPWKKLTASDLPPSPQGSSREICRTSPVRVTSLPSKASKAFPMKVTPLLPQLPLKTNVPSTLLSLWKRPRVWSQLIKL